MARCKRIDFVAWAPEDAEAHGNVCVADKKVMNEHDWRQTVSGYFERWGYGREIAPETGRRHYQCRGYLKGDLAPDIIAELSKFGLCHITPCSVKDFEYIKKDGDYWLSWELWRPEYTWIEEHHEEWMTQAENLPNDMRTIEILVDEVGNHAKTAWAMYQAFVRHKAVYCPVCEKGVDLVNFVLQASTADWYIVDTPRAFEFTKSWAVAIEQIKNGYVYDHRYSYREKILPCRPRITVLCNALPDYETYFSADRVLPLRITPQGYLWSV